MGLDRARAEHELFGHLAAGVLVGGLIYANNQTINVLKGFWGLLSGGN